MASYVVMEPPGGQDGAGKEAVLVRDGFAWLGFIMPLLWLLWHRLWLEAAIVLALTVGLVILSEFDSFILATPFLSLLVSLYVGLEGAAMRIAGLTRRGWRQADIVEADSHSDAELRYMFDAAPAGEMQRAATPTPSSSSRAASRPAGPALGLLGYSGNGR